MNAKGIIYGSELSFGEILSGAINCEKNFSFNELLLLNKWLKNLVLEEMHQSDPDCKLTAVPLFQINDTDFVNNANVAERNSQALKFVNLSKCLENTSKNPPIVKEMVGFRDIFANIFTSGLLTQLLFHKNQ